MIRAVGLALVLALSAAPFAFAADDDDDKVPEGVKKEEEGIYEIDDAKCKMGTMDIKLDKDFSVILISRY